MQIGGEVTAKRIAGKIVQTLSFFVAIAILLAPVGPAMADSINPSSVSATVPVGGSVTVHKIVTVNAGAPTTSKVDVVFLADTTGSMGTAISSVISSASTILSTTAGLGDVQFAVAEYKDFLSGDPFGYRLDQGLTSSQAAVQTGINMWLASGGGDLPEANLFGLDQVANLPFRSGSARIAVWFGDAGGHDPSNGVTEAIATAHLVANNVKVEALNVGFGGLDSTGQASRITAATGGTLFSGIASSAVATAIQNAITTAVSTYSSVCLDPVGASPDVGVALSPTCITGSFDRSIDRTFDYDATFTGLTPGLHTFDVNALVDGGIVATEHDTLTVGAAAVPEPSTILLLASGLGALVVIGRKRLSNQ